jgi:hypothetical protein
MIAEGQVGARDSRNQGRTGLSEKSGAGIFAICRFGRSHNSVFTVISFESNPAGLPHHKVRLVRELGCKYGMEGDVFGIVPDFKIVLERIW